MKDAIDELHPARELDYLIAKIVFGKTLGFRPGELLWKDTKTGEEKYADSYWIDVNDKTLYLHAIDGYTGLVPYYSTNIMDAYSILEKMDSWWETHRVCFEIGNARRDGDEGGNWWVNVIHEEEEHQHSVHITYAETLPLAICRAAYREVLTFKWT